MKLHNAGLNRWKIKETLKILLTGKDGEKTYINRNTTDTSTTEEPLAADCRKEDRVRVRSYFCKC
jgi:hypothetical protein